MLEFIKYNLRRFYNGYFPRELLVITTQNQPSRDVVLDFDEFFNQWWNYNGYSNVYTSVYSEHQKAKLEFDRLYFDFDCKTNLKLAKDEALRLKNYFESEFDGNVLLLESGSKGYTLYAFFEDIKLKNYKIALRQLCLDLKKDLHLSTLDSTTFGDWNQISRIPYSVNMKSGNLRKPVGKHFVPIEDLPVIFKRGHLERILRVYNEKYSQLSQSKNYAHLSQTTNHLGYKKELELYFKILSSLPHVAGNGYKRAIMALIAPRLAVSYDIETAKFIMSDFLQKTNSTRHEIYSHYQIEHSKRKGVFPWRLDTFLNKFPELKPYYMVK